MIKKGFIIDPKKVQRVFDFWTSTLDQSQLLIITEPKQSKLTYYAGFVWTKIGQIKNQKEWNKYLYELAQKVNNPLEVLLD